MTQNWQDQIPNFDQFSYYAGISTAFAEVVGAGVKQLALSHPYSAEDLDIMLEPSKQIAADYGVVIMVEDDLLVTPLFPAKIARGKYVIFFAKDIDVLNTYRALKDRKEKASESWNPSSEMRTIAQEFGRLLSYSDESIEAMLTQ
ncbi:MAG: hypothetical protein ACI9EW_002753 [Cellvibrionaceae bacterium]|jgi:hypothetical protein